MLALFVGSAPSDLSFVSVLPLRVRVNDYDRHTEFCLLPDNHLMSLWSSGDHIQVSCVELTNLSWPVFHSQAGQASPAH